MADTNNISLQTSFDKSYTPQELKKISPEHGDRYLIEFHDILTKYLGPILLEPKIDHEDGKIVEINFKEPPNLSDQSSASTLEDISNELKDQLNASIDQLNAEKKNPNSQQALLILKAFDEKWLDVNNLLFSNDQVILRCWGVQNRFMPKEGTDFENFGTSDDTTKSFTWVPVLVVVSFIILFLFMKSCNYDSIVDNGVIETVEPDPSYIHKNLIIKVIDNKRNPIKDVLVYLEEFYKTSNYGKKIDFVGYEKYISNNQGITSLDFYKIGNYTIHLKHKDYHSKTLKVKLNGSNWGITKKVKMRKKNIITKIKEFIFPSSRA